MAHEEARQAFASQIDSWVVRAVDDGVKTFENLLSTLPGVYPAYAIESVQRLRKENRIRPTVALGIERQARSKIAGQANARSALPPPHPLDFEWRFDRSTGKRLLDIAASYCRDNEKILLLGTPTLAAAAAKSLPSDKCIYVGEDNEVTRSVAALNSRISNPLEVRLCGPSSLRAREAAAVLVDPPWYFDFIRPMLRAAAYGCRPGGCILVSLPPIGANSHVTADRTRLFSLFGRLSLNVLSITPDVVRYDTPFFEANALAAQGYLNIPKAWRRADLFLLQKPDAAPNLSLGFASRRRPWREVTIGRMRLFVTNRASGIDGPCDELVTLVPGDILDSVKRTDPRRQQVDVWTSGNRIFGSSRPDLVRLAAEAAAVGEFTENTNRLSREERDAVRRLRYFLGELAIREQFEERGGLFVEASCRTATPKSRLMSLPTESSTIRSGLST